VIHPLIQELELKLEALEKGGLSIYAKEILSNPVQLKTVCGAAFTCTGKSGVRGIKPMQIS